MILASLIGLFLFGAFFYTQFLVDDSLRNLEITLAANHDDSATQSGVDRYAYRNILQGLVLEEAAKEQVNFKTLAFLELALRSFDKTSARGNYGHEHLYLEQVRAAKLLERSFFSRIMVQIYEKIQAWISSLLIRLRGGGHKQSLESHDLDEAYEYSGLPLLDEARAREKRGEYSEAETLYRTYLKFNLSDRDKGWIQTSLAYVLMREKKNQQAEELLWEVWRGYSGLKEADVAQSLLRQLDRLRAGQSQVLKLADLNQKGLSLDEGSRFRLGLGYLASYDNELARTVFLSLQHAANRDIRQRAIFYLGLLLKMAGNLDESQPLIRDLLKEQDINRDLILALNVQLADIYYQRGEADKSLSAYDNLLVQSYGDSTLPDNLRNAWMALAELEKASIYIFYLHDIKKGNESLERAEAMVPGVREFAEVMESLYHQPPTHLRDLAFRAIQQGQIRAAYDLLTKSLKNNPEDAWALSAFGTVSLLLGKIEQGLQSAKRGYHQGPDEYTCSVLAYIYEILGQPEEAEKLYGEALVFNGDYLPAHFNLGNVYISQKKYEEALKKFTNLSQALRDANKIIRAKTFNNRGYSFYALARVKESVESFQRALTLIPEFEIARRNLAAASV